MKAKNLLIVFFIAIFFSGCVVYSFYPLYTEKDLFPNDLLIGEWMDDEGTHWSFKHPMNSNKDFLMKGERELGVDSTSYVLNITDKDKVESEFGVHIVKLGDHYFLDFYLIRHIGAEEVYLADFHLIPVHTFAKVIIDENQLQINWFDQDWLGKLIKQNKIRIHHESNEDFVLLTAQPKELQKFVTKYVNSKEAFKDGLQLELKRQ